MYLFFIWKLKILLGISFGHVCFQFL
jgi:hypothetical protein